MTKLCNKNRRESTMVRDNEILQLHQNDLKRISNNHKALISNL